MRWATQMVMRLRERGLRYIHEIWGFFGIVVGVHAECPSGLAVSRSFESNVDFSPHCAIS